MKADLHVHSIISDCSETRENILKKAKELGITHLAFTEHDTTLKSDELNDLSEKFGIELFKAIEISAYDFKTNKKAHILGFNYKTTDNLEKLCRPTLEKRHKNCLKQIEILKELGYKLEVSDIMKYNVSGIIYKQHILDFLYKTKQTDSIFGDVYRNIFKNGGRCDFDIDYVSAEDAVKAVVKDGGIACLAHPAQQNNFEILERLVDCGLKAIELNHPSHKKEDREYVEEVAKKYNLFLSGGSDFHGKFESQSSNLGDYLATSEFVTFIKSI